MNAESECALNRSTILRHPFSNISSSCLASLTHHRSIVCITATILRRFSRGQSLNPSMLVMNEFTSSHDLICALRSNQAIAAHFSTRSFVTNHTNWSNLFSLSSFPCPEEYLRTFSESMIQYFWMIFHASSILSWCSYMYDFSSTRFGRTCDSHANTLFCVRIVAADPYVMV